MAETVVGPLGLVEEDVEKIHSLTRLVLGPHAKEVATSQEGIYP